MADVETGALPTTHLVTRRGVQVDAIGLSKTVRGGKRVLNDISLTVRPSQLVAIVGGSGAGKTMLLEALTADSSLLGHPPLVASGDQ